MAVVARAEELAGTRPAALHEEAKERGPTNVSGLYQRLPIPATRDQLTGDMGGRRRKIGRPWDHQPLHICEAISLAGVESKEGKHDGWSVRLKWLDRMARHCDTPLL